jgi:hypothetical protein
VDFQVSLKIFIPYLYVWAGEVCQDPLLGWTNVIYNGNNRTWSPTIDISKSKETNVAYLTPGSGGGSGTPWHQPGYTKRYSKASALGSGTVLVEDIPLHDCYFLDDAGFGGDDAQIDYSGNVATSTASVHFYGQAHNRLLGLGDWAPPFDWDVTMTISTSNPASPGYAVEYRHDCFPSYEVYIGAQLVYPRPPRSSGPEDWLTIGSCLAGVLSQYADSTIGTVVQ